MREVLQNSVQMSRLIDQLLALARADAGVEVLHSEPLNVTDLLHEVAQEWRRQFADAHIQFIADLPESELWIEADYLAFKRLINILLENAWRYTPSSKSVILALKEQTQSQGRDVAEISVTDTGIGIALEFQKSIFERFCHIARPVNGDYCGSGLGLALGEWIAQRHKTTIKVQSAPGIGSRFSLLVPMCLPEQEPGLTCSADGRFCVDCLDQPGSGGK